MKYLLLTLALAARQEPAVDPAQIQIVAAAPYVLDVPALSS